MKPWRERLLDGITPEDMDDADNWGYCAVSEQRELHPFVILPMDAFEPPEDATLARLGNAFGRAVRALEVDHAERILADIEDRVQEIKREGA